ncbi:hypothetical protein TeGR_g4316 [Tetraparma gracilis]|uniref:BPL/LPL catalytic domain-containing protein n=1 Tax=Tetraparma gracilis TaxID=2962635 RepID=A0ABQ6NB82_9STRA|nr:hypothetical protein TeGR_g4316 [Tetraparma gracilis]
MYPLLSLPSFRPDLHWYQRALEELALRVLPQCPRAVRLPGLTGVFAPGGGGKLAAVGVSCRRWVTSHGLSINVSEEATPGGLAAPCGIEGAVGASAEEVWGVWGGGEDMGVAKGRAREAFEEVFCCETVDYRGGGGAFGNR